MCLNVLLALMLFKDPVRMRKYCGKEKYRHCCCFLVEDQSYVILLRYKDSTERYKENVVEMCI